jgi:hypothetical protein
MFMKDPDPPPPQVERISKLIQRNMVTNPARLKRGKTTLARPSSNRPVPTIRSRQLSEDNFHGKEQAVA